MKAIDLTKTLTKYKKGWVAIGKNHQVVAHDDTYEGIVKKISKLEEKVILMPATEDYSQYIT